MKPFIGMICVLLLVGGAWCGVGAADDDASDASLEQRLWAMALQAQNQQALSVASWHHPRVDDLIQRVTARLWSRVDTDLPPVQIRIIADARPDARAYPNGLIILTTGMLAHARSQDQLAMIISHEIIHYTHRHALAALRRLQDPFSQGNSFGQGFARTAFGSAQQLAALYEASEKEADREGLALMQAAGYCAGEVLPLLLSFQDGQVWKPGNAAAVFMEDGLLKKRTAQIRTLVDSTYGDPSCRVSPRDRHAYRTDMAPALLANGRSALRQGQWTAALDNIREYLGLAPDDPEAHYILGEIKNRNGRQTESALSAYQAAIHLDGSFAPAYQAIGFIHFKAGRLRQAHRYFATSLALAPDGQNSEFIREYMQLCGE